MSIELLCLVRRRQDLAIELLQGSVICLFGQVVTNPVTTFRRTARSIFFNRPEAIGTDRHLVRMLVVSEGEEPR